MPTTTYIHANGVKIGHIRDGVRTDYLTDALGTITATKNQSQTVVNTYRYKPYGGLLARTGTGEDLRYLWTGNTGSRVTNARFANQYNVARHYANGPAKWTTVDPLWPDELPYSYVTNSPIQFVDPEGLLILIRPTPRPITGRGGSGWSPPPRIGPGPGGREWTTRVQPPISTVQPPRWTPGGTIPPPRPSPLPMPSPIFGNANPPPSTDLVDPYLIYGIPLPGEDEWPAIGPRVCNRFSPPIDPCKELADEKQLRCPGNNKQGNIIRCKGPSNGQTVTQEMCNQWRRYGDMWDTCYKIRWDELRWRCIKNKSKVKGHKDQADIARNAANNCKTLLRRHCKS